MSRLFGRTLREPPAEAEGAGWQALLRAAYVRPLGGGRYAYLPLGWNSCAELSRRLRLADLERWPDRLALPSLSTQQVAAAARALASSDIQSYRQLPVVVRFEGPWRHEKAQSRGGPLCAAEGAAQFALRMDADEGAAAAAYEASRRTLMDLFKRCGLSIIVARDPTAQAPAHAYAYLSDDAVESALLCDGCGYAALAEVAACGRPPVEPEELLPLEKIATPHTSTIADLAQFLAVPESRTAKAVFLMAAAEEGEQFVFAVVRGDTDVSERKLLARLAGLGLRVTGLRAATDVEIRATGATPGYASPVGLLAGARNVRIVVDELAAQSPNLVAGANAEGYHLLNTNCDRDYKPSLIADIALARAGDGCPVCSKRLRAAKVAVLGLTGRLPVERGAPTFLDASGRVQPVLISVLQLDLGALLTAVAETHRDEQGVAMPPAAAPYAVHLISMPGGEPAAEALYAALSEQAITCLWDDRSESAGVKFTDADLIGAPLRITLGKRSLQAGGAEFKRRAAPAGADKWIVPLDQVAEVARQTLADIEANTITGAKELPYGEYLR